MRVGIRELRNDTAAVIGAVEAGERVVLTVHGRPMADIVPHRSRRPWLSGDDLAARLAERAADPGLATDLADLAGATLDEVLDDNDGE